jgi:hypothetical protein
MKTNIQSVPDEILDIDESGLKNLAGWLARYAKFDVLNQEEQSTFVADALSSGSLVHFEPILSKCVGKKYDHWGPSQDYDVHEFSVCLKLESGDDYFSLCMQFKSNDKVWAYTTDSADRDTWLTDLADKLSDIVGINLNEGPGYEMAWLEADQIVLKYLKQMHAMHIQPPPTEE